MNFPRSTKMALFDFLRKKEKTEILVENDEELEQKRSYSRMSSQAMQERKRLELDNIRLEAAKRKEELEEELEEIRHEREVRRLEREVRMQEALERLSPEDAEEIEGDSPESLLIGLLSKVMTKNPQSQSPAAVAENPPQPVTFSSDKVKQIWENMTEQQKIIARQLSDDQIRDYLINQIPNIDKATLDQAIAVVRA